MNETRHLIGMRDCSRDTITRLLNDAVALRERVQGGVQARGSHRMDLLAGRTVALLFLEPSTRTRFSFEMASRRLGADCLVFTSAGSSTVKGESLLDTARVLKSIGADLFVIRHPGCGAPHQLASRLDIPLVNAGDGINEHPTQALLDALTLRDHFSTLKGITVAIVGDIMHSRVARSNCFALKKLGARVLVAGPGTLCPDRMGALGVDVRHTIDDVVDEADAIMMLRIQRERIGGSSLPSDAEYGRLYGMNQSRLERLREGAIVMHPAPMNRGVEINDEVADGTSSVVFRQAANGVFVRMAALRYALGAPPMSEEVA